MTKPKDPRMEPLGFWLSLGTKWLKKVEPETAERILNREPEPVVIDEATTAPVMQRVKLYPPADSNEAFDKMFRGGGK